MPVHKIGSLSLREELLPESEKAQLVTGRPFQPLGILEQALVGGPVPRLLELDRAPDARLELVQGVQKLW